MTILTVLISEGDDVTKTNTAGGRAAYVLLLALVLVLGVLVAPTGAAAQATIRAWPASYGLSAVGQLGQLDAAAAVALRVGASPRLAAATAPGGSRQDPETVFWQSVANSTNPADFEAYLARWPEGVYSPLARTRLAALRPTRRAGDLFRDCPTCPDLVVIPAGEFMMGSPASEEGRQDREGPRHRVAVNSFALGRYEVTRDEYRAFVEATGHPSSGCWVLNADGDEAIPAGRTRPAPPAWVLGSECGRGRGYRR